MIALDLIRDTDTSFRQAVGELVAWKYLWRYEKIFCIGLSTRIPFAETWSRASRTLCKGLDKRQIDYLNSPFGAQRVFDFLGRLQGENLFCYLVEVKTTRRRKFLGTKKRAEEIARAKSLGFVPFRVYIRFLDNWKFEVTSGKL